MHLPQDSREHTMLSTMHQDSENWDRLQTLFHLAEETLPEDRERALLEQCRDEALVERALALFRSSARLESGSSTIPTPFPQSRVGAYTLIRLLGVGGIGAVYLAERIVGGTPQLIALKMLAPHAAGPSFLERFHREQHILGSLDHPNITRMIDAGLTEAGQPYLVMERVEGEHLDVYCDKHKLGIAERLRLFLQICGAVSYAHRVLVVHLDLKPSNILVTDEGSVKLLDFGTSKLIQTDSLLTTTVMATPAYASPEQLRNEPVTTGCDVYALGAILFELLSGRKPYLNVSLVAMVEYAIKEQEPDKLPNAVSDEAALLRSLSKEKLRQVLRGDLETIAAKCLRLLPKDRYASVDALVREIERYLTGRPVLARPQTTVYRLSKFVRRNPKGFALTAGAAALLIAALSYAEIKQRKAIEQGRRAVQMETFMYSLFSIANSQYFGKPTMSVNDFLNLGIKTLPLYIHDRGDLRTAQNSLSKSLWVNDDYPDADKTFRDTTRSAQADGDINAEVESLAYTGDIAYRKGNLETGSELTSRALRLADQPKVHPFSRVLAKRMYAVNREVNGQASDQTLQLLRNAVKEAQDDQLAKMDVADAIQDLALALAQRGRWDDAESWYWQALRLYSLDPAYACTGAQVEGQLGYIARRRGDFASGFAHHQHAFATEEKCFGKDSAEAAYQERNIGQDLIWMGRGPEAAAVLERNLTALKKKKAESEGPSMAKVLYLLANAYVMTGRPAEAISLVKQEIRITEGKLNPASRGYGAIYLVYAQALAREGREIDALRYAALADKTLYPVQPDDSYTDKVQSTQAHALYASLQVHAGSKARTAELR